MSNTAFYVATLGKLIMGYFQWLSIVTIRNDIKKIFEPEKKKLSKKMTRAALILTILLSVATTGAFSYYFIFPLKFNIALWI